MPKNRALAIGAYLVAGSLILVPLLDATLAIHPMRPGDFRWRFGAAGVVSNAIVTPNAGVLLMLFAAISFGHRVVRRIIGGLATLAAVFWAGAMVLFILDALQMKPSVPPQMHTSFEVASVLAFVKMTIDLTVLTALGVIGLSGARGETTGGTAAMLVTDPKRVTASS